MKAFALAVVLSAAGLSHATLLTGLKTEKIGPTWQSPKQAALQKWNFDKSSDFTLIATSQNPYGTLASEIFVPDACEIQTPSECHPIGGIQSTVVDPLTVTK